VSTRHTFEISNNGQDGEKRVEISQNFSEYLWTITVEDAYSQTEYVCMEGDIMKLRDWLNALPLPEGGAK
jgi:hypothetical protein